MTGADARITVRLTPRAAVDRVDGVVEGALRVRVAAPAVDGAANASLMKLIAAELGISRSDVRIVAGATGRNKLVAIDGIDPARVAARWPDLRS